MQQANNNQNEIFWFDSPKELYIHGRYTKLLVKKHMAMAEFFNTVTRSVICLALILFVLLASPIILLLLFVALLVIVVLYYLLQYTMGPEINNFNSSSSLPINNVIKEQFQEKSIDKLDSNNTIKTNNLLKNLYTDSYYSSSIGSNSVDASSFGSLNSRQNARLNQSLYGYDSLEDINSSYNFSDLQNNVNNCGFNPANASDADINNGYSQKDLDNFRSDLYETVDNVYEKKNFDRQFNTIQNHTNPTNSFNAAKWIHATPVTCKETSGQCLKYEDLTVVGHSPILSS